MSFEITTNFVQQFRSSLALLAQQKKARLRDTTIVETGIRGQTAWFDQIGSTAAQRMTQRNGDTPLANTPHRRRRIDLAPYNWADLIDSVDKVRMLTDPTSTYVMAGNAAMNRAIDDIIIAAFFADASTGADGTTTVSFPSGNQVAVNSWAYGSGSGNAGMTISKMIEARAVLLGGEAVDENDPQQIGELYCAMSAKQISNLLSTTEVTSRDYAGDMLSLRSGMVPNFMGCKIIRTQRLGTDGSSYRRVPMWQKQGMYLGIGEDVKVEVTPRADKNYSTQPYYEMLLGAARVEEARVVEIKCLES